MVYTICIYDEGSQILLELMLSMTENSERKKIWRLR